MRWPGWTPAARAASVRRRVLIWRPGAGAPAEAGWRRASTAVAVAVLVDSMYESSKSSLVVTTGGAADVSADVSADGSAAGAIAGPSADGTVAAAGADADGGCSPAAGCSARAAGASLLTRRAANGRAAPPSADDSASAAAEPSPAAEAEASWASPAPGAWSCCSSRPCSSSALWAFLTTRMARLTAGSFFGKYLLRIFSASSFGTVFEGTDTSTPSRRTSSMMRFDSIFSSLARS
jgi:hypothetical protein